MIFDYKRAHMYVENIPEINDTPYFLVKKDAYTSLVDDWLCYIDTVLSNPDKLSNSNSKSFFASIDEEYIPGSMDFDKLTESAKERLGLGGSFKVLQKSITQGVIKYEVLMNYDMLTKLFFQKTNKSETVRQYVIDRFFLMQWSKGRLLYPLLISSKIVLRAVDYELFIGNNELLEHFISWLKIRDFKKQTQNQTLSVFIKIITGTGWRKISDITEVGLQQCEKIVFDKGVDTKTEGKKFLYATNEIRRLLISLGRQDITTPKSINEKRNSAKDKNVEPFSFVDLQLYPNMENIVIKTRTFLKTLELDGLSKSTIKGYRTQLKYLFEYFMEYYKNTPITPQTIENMFNPDNQNNFRNYLISKTSKDARFRIMQKAAKALHYCELMTAYSIKHIPKFKKVVKTPYRKAMPLKVLRGLIDILINRPPNPVIKWDNTKADISWWKHSDVYPVFPLILLFNLFIPIRGGQARHLCRKNSFVFDENGNIEAFIINVDKNVNRKDLQRVPNVWEELNIFKDFLKWHKEYFPNLAKIKYQDDENTPWDDIYPLFILPNKFEPINRLMHYSYFKKLLLIYQIEENNRLIEAGKEPSVKIVYRKDGKEVSNDLEEVNKTNLTNMGKLYGAEYDIHSIRVTGVTRYLEAGLNFKVVMTLTGHKTIAMVLDTYNRLNYDERQKMLSSASRKIFLGIDEDTVENTKTFVHEELAEAYEKGALKEVFEKNGLFCMDNREATTIENKRGQSLSGIDIAEVSHPSTWFPMIHGICPGVQCPSGREKKCSLCPYFITGRIFLDGITHQANLTSINFYRISQEINKEQESGNYENKPKSEQLELITEEMLGWNEILQKINTELEVGNDPQNNHMPTTRKNSVSKLKQTHPTIAYLETNYRAKIMGVEYDKEGLSLLTIKAFNLAKNIKDQTIYKIANDEDKVIDYLMGYYQKHKRLNSINTFIDLMDGVLDKPKRVRQNSSLQLELFND